MFTESPTNKQEVKFGRWERTQKRKIDSWVQSLRVSTATKVEEMGTEKRKNSQGTDNNVIDGIFPCSREDSSVPLTSGARGKETHVRKIEYYPWCVVSHRNKSVHTQKSSSWGMSFLGCSQTNTPQVRMLKITVAPKYCHRPHTRDRDNFTTNVRAESRIIRYLDKDKADR